MSATKILRTRQLLGSMAINVMTGPCSIRQHMSKASLNCSRYCPPSATYRLVHASRAFAATRDVIDELEAPVPMPMPYRRAECLPMKRSEQEQRRVTKALSAERVKNLSRRKLQHQKVRCLPFKRPSESEAREFGSRRYSSVQDLLRTMSEPHQLANELLSLAKELSSEKSKNKRLQEGYQDLLEQMTIRGKK
ncbi:uncharacterized protein [Drosophila tropicalis]|uniref:uncharacterized protein n=1 Tax=Drosophila tropicalis TaxID=46794 RepID=UPI0035AB7249